MTASVLRADRRPAAPNPTTGLARWLRGTAVGVAALALSSGGHRLAGGHVPSVGVCLLVAAAMLGTGVILSGRRWRLPTLLAVLVSSQVAFHVAFAGPEHAMPGMGSMPALAATSGTSSWSGPVMIIAHLLAAGLTAVMLRRGEDALWNLLGILSWVVRGARLALLPTVNRLAAPNRPAATGRSRACAQWFEYVAPRRGPPQSLSV